MGWTTGGTCAPCGTKAAPRRQQCPAGRRSAPFRAPSRSGPVLMSRRGRWKARGERYRDPRRRHRELLRTGSGLRDDRQHLPLSAGLLRSRTRLPGRREGRPAPEGPRSRRPGHRAAHRPPGGVPPRRPDGPYYRVYEVAGASTAAPRLRPDLGGFLHHRSLRLRLRRQPFLLQPDLPVLANPPGELVREARNPAAFPAAPATGSPSRRSR